MEAGVETAPVLSVTVNVTAALPLKSAAGWKSRPVACAAVMVCPASTSVPSASDSELPEGMLTMVTLVTVPSTSVPPSDSGKVLSSRPPAVPAVATGASLTGVRLMSVVPEALAPPSLTVKPKLPTGEVPL